MNKMSLLNFDIEDTGIYKIKQNKSGTYRKRIANPAYVEKVIANIEKDTILFVVRYKNYGDWKSLQISQGKLHKSHLEFFMSKGLDISNTTQDDVFNCLLESAQYAKISHSHSNIGWVELEEYLMYRLNEMVSLVNFQSNYEGRMDIKEHGSLIGWLDTVRSHVQGHSPLELSLAIGMSAPLIGLYDMKMDGAYHSLMFHIIGNSSMGKSSAAALAVSPFGRPTNKGLVKNFNGTANALEQHVANNYGVPIVLDETSMHTLTTNQLSTFVYQIADNQGRID